jgi:hypothetical protein
VQLYILARTLTDSLFRIELFIIDSDTNESINVNDLCLNTKYANNFSETQES